MTRVRVADVLPSALSVADALADHSGHARVKPPDGLRRVVVVGLAGDVEVEGFTVQPTGIVTDGRQDG
jgi:hypothetical protein